MEREINQAQLTDKPLLIDVVDGLHRDVLIAEGRLEPSMIATLRGVEQRRSFAVQLTGQESRFSGTLGRGKSHIL